MSDNAVATISYLASALVAAPLAIASFVEENSSKSFSSTALNIFCASRLIHGMLSADSNRIMSSFLAKKANISDKLAMDELKYSELRARKKALRESAIVWGAVSALTFFKATSKSTDGPMQGDGKRKLELTAAAAALALSGACCYRSVVKDHHDKVEISDEDMIILKEVEAVTNAAGEGVIIPPEPRLPAGTTQLRGLVRPKAANRFTARNPHDNSLWFAAKIRA